MQDIHLCNTLKSEGHYTSAVTDFFRGAFWGRKNVGRPVNRIGLLDLVLALCTLRSAPSRGYLLRGRVAFALRSALFVRGMQAGREQRASREPTVCLRVLRCQAPRRAPRTVNKRRPLTVWPPTQRPPKNQTRHLNETLIFIKAQIPFRADSEIGAVWPTFQTWLPALRMFPELFTVQLFLIKSNFLVYGLADCAGWKKGIITRKIAHVAQKMPWSIPRLRNWKSVFSWILANQKQLLSFFQKRGGISVSKALSHGELLVQG